MSELSEAFSSQIKKIQTRLETRGETVGFAESCTGGLLSATLSTRSGISKVFLGSVVSYHSRVKNELLGVPQSLLQVMGEVSTPVALEMARGVLRHIKTNWALAITGVAGPTGGTLEKPVGMVCFALVGPGYSETRTEKFEPKSREYVQQAAVGFALKWLTEAI